VSGEQLPQPVGKYAVIELAGLAERDGRGVVATLRPDHFQPRFHSLSAGMTDSNAFSITEVVSALAAAAAGLSPGQTASLPPNTLQHPQDVTWQLQTMHYDASRKEIQYMGKPASSQSHNFGHYIFSEAS